MDIIFRFIRNIIVFLLISTVVKNLLSESKYAKYISFYMGLVLIIMLVTPVVVWLKQDDLISNFLWEEQLKQEVFGMGIELSVSKDMMQNDILTSYEEELENTLIDYFERQKFEVRKVDIKLEDNNDKYGSIRTIRVDLKESPADVELWLEAIANMYGIDKEKIEIQGI